jgi:hypothetical protein
VTVTLNDGRVLVRRVSDFPGTPESPLDQAALREKFLILTRHCSNDAMTRLFERILHLEDEPDLDWLAVGPA